MATPLPKVVFETSFGQMVFELFEDDVPNTVANFVSLADAGFYDNTLSHRLIAGFMVQLGDPKTKDQALAGQWGSGGPGYCIDCEFDGAGNQQNLVGTLSMAHRGPDSGGSQFFINDNNNHFLDQKHTVFGRLIEGDEVRRKIMAVPTGPNDRPQQEVRILSIRSQDKRDHPYEPRKNANL